MRDLPPQLIKAFASTLEDSVESDLLLHIIDAHDPLVEDKISVVNHILDSIGATQQRVYVFNKCDVINEQERVRLQELYADKPLLWISAVTGEGVDALKEYCKRTLLRDKLLDDKIG